MAGNEKIIRAVYTDNTIRVYQAYNDIIADEAVSNNKFGKSFSMNRMTWIKPSFLWMMYRSGWATKQGQNRILATRLFHLSFELGVPFPYPCQCGMGGNTVIGNQCVTNISNLNFSHF